MPFNIEEFKSSVNKQRGLASPALFGVTIAPRQIKTLSDTKRAESVSFLAYAANIPGVSSLVTDMRRQGYGPIERRVTGMTMNDVNMTFLLDNNGAVLSYFHDWLRSIYSFGNLSGEGQVDETTNGTLGQVGYYDDYVSDIIITMYAQDSNKIVEYKLIDAYPGQVNQVELSWRQIDEIAELQVTFYYRHWNATYYDADERGPKGKRLNLLQFVSKLKSAVEIVKSFKKPRSVGDAINLLNNGKTLLKGFGG